MIYQEFPLIAFLASSFFSAFIALFFSSAISPWNSCFFLPPWIFEIGRFSFLWICFLFHNFFSYDIISFADSINITSNIWNSQSFCIFFNFLYLIPPPLSIFIIFPASSTLLYIPILYDAQKQLNDSGYCKILW